MERYLVQIETETHRLRRIAEKMDQTIHNLELATELLKRQDGKAENPSAA